MGVVVKEKEKGSGEWWVFIFCNGLKKTKKIGKDKKLAFEIAKGIEERFVSIGKFKQPVPYRSVKNRKREGRIYIMSNSGHNYLKIGVSQNSIKKRKQDLSTGSPTPFKIEYSKKVKDCFMAEKMVHKLLNYSRVEESREFFDSSLDVAKNIIKRVVKIVDG